MIRILLFAISLLLLNNTLSMADNEFSLKIDMVYSEAGKDSNSQRYLVEVKGKNVSYEYSYSGFPFPENSNESVARTLSPEEFDGIIAYIKNKKINTSIAENKPQTANGSTNKIHLSLLLTLEGQTVESEISGILKISRADGKTRGITIENKTYINDVQFLVGRLKGWSGLKNIEN